MAAVSTDSLVDSLQRYRLLEPEQLAEVTRLLTTSFPEPKGLADELARRGWLTPYQAAQLLQGRGKDLLLGSYLLLEPLGEGGMGQVFKARNWKLGRLVALKLIRKERIDSPETVRRFRREVRALAALSHPNIVAAYDSDEINGACLLAMEYIEGAIDLAALAKKSGPLPVAQACEYVRQTALGLQHAHERGLVHRDVKPHNLLLTADGQVVKILDLGLARLDQGGTEADGSVAVTKEGAVLGSPDYLSPEQAQHMHTVDIRADIYSLGCTFYYLLAGRPPFAGGAFFDKVYRHRYEEPDALETLRPDVPSPVAALVRKMMAKQPEDRCQTPAEVAAALTAVLHGNIGWDAAMTEGVQNSPPPSAEALDSSFSLTDQPDDTTAAAPPIRRRKSESMRWLGYVLSGALSLAIGAGLVALLLYHLPAAKPASVNKPNEGDKGRTDIVVPPPVPDKPDEPNPAPPDDAKLPPEVFEDFESGKYGDWKKTGSAFGARPASGTLPNQQVVSGYGGKYLVNTFFNGDRSTGTLTSPAFTIRHAYIRFRIGGGRFPGKECINLLVGGQVVRTATGRDSERLEWDFWNVMNLHRQTARIEIVDRETVGWGHINIDDIMFTNESPR